MSFRRRGLLGCLVLAFVFVLGAPLLFWGWDFPSRLSGAVSGLDLPEWVQENFKPFAPPLHSQVEEEVKETKVYGPNHVGVETTIPGGAYTQGITVLNNLYLSNGTLFILTSDQSKFPPETEMVGKPVGWGLDSVAQQDLQFLHPSTEILGQRAIRITGLSVIITDAPSSMNNFYRWWAEIVLRAWRVYSKLGTEQKRLPLPSRFILPRASDGEWRDDTKLTGPFMRVAFPNTAIEQADYWKDLINLGTTIIFDRVILVSREAATQNSNRGFWSEIRNGAIQSASSATGGFWEPIRQAVVRNTLGCLPDPRDVILGQVRVGGHHTRPLVTYLSSQHSTPRLDENDHEGLIDALQELERAQVCDFHVLDMERASLEEQVEYAAKSTVLVGVRGIGLTHQLWMPPSRRSTILEIGWSTVENSYDQAVVAEVLRHQHYAMWNDTLMTAPEGSYDKENDPEADNSSSSYTIPVYGPAVAQLIKDRLSL